MSRGRALVGMAGWVYPPWRGTFYPAGLAQKNELAWASTRVTSIELNGSFYSLQKPSSWITWRDATPPGFVFSVKAPRYITYVKKLRDIREPLADFLASGILALGSKLGAILWQLPPTLAWDEDLIDEFLTALPRTTGEALRQAHHHTDRMDGKTHLAIDSDRALHHALEVRHDSFLGTGLAELAQRHGIAIVYGDSGGMYPVIDVTTTGFRYVRLHADAALYPNGWYEPADLDRWAATIGGWLDAGQDAYVYFTDDTKVRSPIDAMALIERLGA